MLSSPDALDPESVGPTAEAVRVHRCCACCCCGLTCATQIDDRSPIEFSSTPAREIWQRLSAVPAGGFDRAAFVDALDPTLAGVVRTMYADPEPLPDDESSLRQALDQSLLTLRRNQLDDEIESKEFDIREAEAAGDRSGVDRLVREVRDLRQARLDLDRRQQETTVLATTTTTDTGRSGRISTRR